MKHLIIGAAVAAVYYCTFANQAIAHDGGVTVRVTPYRPSDSPLEPYLYLLEIRSSRDQTEVIADRRLLRFVLPPNREQRRGRRVCQHPDRPVQTEDHRIVMLNAGEVWREWFDLRMYCWGRALDRIQPGEVMHAQYGFTRRGRYRWIVDPPGQDPPPVHFLDGNTVEAPTVTATHEATPEPDPNAELLVGMLPADVHHNDVLAFRVWVRGNRDRRQRIYSRPDMWRFLVTGPTGRTTCSIPGYHPGPIRDFYRFVTRQRRHVEALDGDGFCRDTFQVAGIYQVTPILELTYDGDEHERPSVVGTFRGSPVPVRIRHGEGNYFPHLLPD